LSKETLIRVFFWKPLKGLFNIMIKVLIADDSLTVREKISEVLAADPELLVVGKAKDGKEAIALNESLRPHLIIMDLVMPVMDGQEATEIIMAYHPTPIIIHSSAANRGEAYRAMDALSAGALTFVEKSSPDWEIELPLMVKKVARIKVITHLKRKISLSPNKTFRFPSISKQNNYNLLAIGASTGGPKVVQNLLSHLPDNFPLPVLLVIHCGESYQSSLIEWLNQNTKCKVRMAVNGTPLQDKEMGVFLAQPGKHLTVKNGLIRIRNDPPVNFCRPSVDVLFESIAADPTMKAIGILLTGMGKDGANGLAAIKKSNGFTIAQDEATSIVFGMPGEAIKKGAVMKILPEHKILHEVMHLLGK